ncbi:MAG: N-acetyl-gamma-glutamyl-phosphate reductase [Halobacteriota archaeon]
MIRVGIIGGSGYTGSELLRLLVQHPKAEVVVVTSRALEGVAVADVHRHLKGFYDLQFTNVDAKTVARQTDVVFLAVPHGAAMGLVPDLIDTVKVIDLSADYRLGAEYEAVYGPHTDPREAVYGLPELHPEVAHTQLCANPGCYPTGAILAAAPLVKEGVVAEVVFDSKSGISGAGAAPTETSHYPNLAENVIPYQITRHRHKAEIVQELDRLGGVAVNFTPHVIPSIRGILTTAHLLLNTQMDGGDITSLYEAFYAGCPFIRFNVPSLRSVRGTNFCDLAIERDNATRRVVAMSAIDNMVKGASGQAIQNMNIMFDLDQTTGLWSPALSL